MLGSTWTRVGQPDWKPNQRLSVASKSFEKRQLERCLGRSQDGGTAWEFFVCLASMKYSQTNTKPSYTPRKLIGGLTEQSAQPEPQNSAGMWRGEVNLGREKPAAGREQPLQAERGRRLGGGGAYRKSTPPQKQRERKWKIGNSRRD